MALLKAAVPVCRYANARELKAERENFKTFLRLTFPIRRRKFGEFLLAPHKSRGPRAFFAGRNFAVIGRMES
jgi:hypothetical protein